MSKDQIEQLTSKIWNAIVSTFSITALDSDTLTLYDFISFTLKETFHPIETEFPVLHPKKVRKFKMKLIKEKEVDD